MALSLSLRGHLANEAITAKLSSASSAGHDNREPIPQVQVGASFVIVPQPSSKSFLRPLARHCRWMKSAKSAVRSVFMFCFEEREGGTSLLAARSLARSSMTLLVLADRDRMRGLLLSVTKSADGRSPLGVIAIGEGGGERVVEDVLKGRRQQLPKGVSEGARAATAVADFSKQTDGGTEE